MSFKRNNHIGLEHVNEVKKSIKQLEDAITGITKARVSLKDNAQEVKSQIHSTISRQLEVLRSREVWLLNQVEIIRDAKDDIFRKQLASMDQALGGLQNSLEYSESNKGTPTASMDGKVTDCLDRFKKMDLHPQETPHICFRADNSTFRSAIHKFGHVDSKGFLQAGVAFADPHNPSSSLPRSFEDYEDADHHVLYKTLESVNRENTSNGTSYMNVQVNFPKLQSPVSVTPPVTNVSSTTQDNQWLLKSVSDSKSTTTTTRDLPGTDPSIQQWLRQLKSGTEMEEDEDFEVVSSVTNGSLYSESIEAASQSSTRTTIPSTNISSVTDHMKKIMTSPTSQWLCSNKNRGSPKADEVEKTSADNWCITEKDIVMRVENKSYGGWCMSEKGDNNQTGQRSSPMEDEDLGLWQYITTYDKLSPDSPSSSDKFKYFKDVKNQSNEMWIIKKST